MIILYYHRKYVTTKKTKKYLKMLFEINLIFQIPRKTRLK